MLGVGLGRQLLSACTCAHVGRDFFKQFSDRTMYATITNHYNESSFITNAREFQFFFFLIIKHMGGGFINLKPGDTKISVSHRFSYNVSLIIQHVH